MSRRPTVLSVNNYYYPRGGAEVVFLEHNQLLQNQGWDVVPFAMHHPNNLQSHWSQYFVEEIEFGGGYSLFGKARRAPKIIYSLEARRKITQLIDAAQPDICHAHNIYHHISPSILGVLRERNVPTVMTLHDLKLACPAYKMLAPDGICERCKGGHFSHVVRNRCIKDSSILSTVVFVEATIHKWLNSYAGNVDRFVVPSKFFIDKFAEWGFERDKFVHIPNFTALGVYQPATSVGRSFAYVGRLGHEKGLATLIRATAAARVSLKLIGTGPEEAALRKLAIDVKADVAFCGYQTGDALRHAIRSARALVLPSEWYENAPMSVLEAYAEGVPVIGAAIGGIPEIVIDGETGAVFPSGSVTDLADKLRWAVSLADREVRNLGDAGRALVETRFSSERYVERIADLYRQLGVSPPSAIHPVATSQ